MEECHKTQKCKISVCIVEFFSNNVLNVICITTTYTHRKFHDWLATLQEHIPEITWSKKVLYKPYIYFTTLSI